MHKDLAWVLLLGVVYLFLFQAALTGCCNRWPSRLTHLFYEFFVAAGKCHYLKFLLDALEWVGRLLTRLFFGSPVPSRSRLSWCGFLNSLMRDALKYPYPTTVFGFVKKWFVRLLEFTYLAYLVPCVETVKVAALFNLLLTVRLTLLAGSVALAHLQHKLLEPLTRKLETRIALATCFIGQLLLASVLNFVFYETLVSLHLVVATTLAAVYSSVKFFDLTRKLAAAPKRA